MALSQKQDLIDPSGQGDKTRFEEHEFTFRNADAKLKTFYLAAGPKEGPLIIFVHGWPAIAKTWKHQIETFSRLGFRVVAPDMPGYGRSSARKVREDYTLQSINIAMASLLDHLGKEAAIWIGHDWGCGAVWSFAEHYPERTIAVAGLAVPSHTIEMDGLEGLVKTVNREHYPIEKYPYGQWEYQAYYEKAFEKATQWFDSDIAACMRVFYSKGSPDNLGKPAFTSSVVTDGGWFGGAPKPDPNWKHIPVQAICIDGEVYKDLVEAMERTSFWGADAWYYNHESNKKYYKEQAKNGGYLHMPTLFIGARYDTICDTYTSDLANAMRKYCTNHTEASIDGGHWIAQEKPVEVNQIITRWILDAVPKQWPGYWTRAYAKAEK